MCPQPRQGGRDGHVTRARARIDVGRGTSLGAMEDAELRCANDQSLVEPGELGPRLHPVEIKIGAEAQGIDGAADMALQVPHACKIDDMDALGAHVRETVTWSPDDLRRSPQLGFHIGRQELLDERTPDGRRELATGYLPAVAQQGERFGAGVEPSRQGGQTLIPHQHQKMNLGQVLRVVGVETAWAVLDSIGAVEGYRLARLDRHGVELFRR
jgi:hypothetical protein